MARLTRASYVKIALVAALCVVLCVGLATCSLSWTSAVRHASGLFTHNYEAASLPEAGDATVSAEGVRDLEVEWMAGGVTIEVVPDEEAAGTIRLVETASGPLRDSARMRWGVTQGCLQIGYGRIGMGLWGCGVGSPDKQLTISVPASVAAQMGSVEIAAASGTYDIGAIGCERLAVSLASGHLTGSGVEAGALDLDIASGEVRLAGAFEEAVSVNAASGNIRIESAACPKRAAVELVSGNLTLLTPLGEGFAADVDKLSGSFVCDFPGVLQEQGRRGRYLYEGGGASFSFSLTSGQIALQPTPDSAAAAT